MNRKQIIYLLPILVLLIGIVSPNQWNRFPIGSTTIVWLLSFVLIVAVLWYKSKFFKPTNKSDYRIVTLYFIWMMIGSIRGMFVAENYWEWKQLISGVLALSLPIFVYVFSIPWVLSNTVKVWLRFAIPLFFLFFIWSLSRGAYHFYLGPVLLLGCFLPVLEKRYRLIVGLLLVLMLLAALGARSQVIKSFVVTLIAGACYLRKIIPGKLLRISHWLFYALPIFFLSLGLSGTFNVFQDLSKNEGKYKETRLVDGKVVEEDLSADTRTFIYVEVLESAIKHNYWLWGRTPARGNDSISFGALQAEELKTGKYERHKNELCFPNVFTWLGVIGMTLYCFIYLRASYLAVYKSKNTFMKFLGVFIAFRFCFGWVEDFNNFDIMSITLWMIIAMGFSEQFRKMSNKEFEYWVRRTTRL